MHVVADYRILFLGFFTGVAASNCFVSVKDVCNSELPEIPNLSSRFPDFVMTPETSHWTFCDVYSINTSTWYKSETRMTTSCPHMYTCGTKFPIWLNDQNPGPDEGVVNRTACLRDFENCCLRSYNLAAVNCGNFMAYCFIDLPSSCHQRYCFDKGYVSTTASKQTSKIVETTTSKYPTTTHRGSTSWTSATINAHTISFKYSRTTTSTESSIRISDSSTNADMTLRTYSSSPTHSGGTTKSSALNSSTHGDTTSLEYSPTPYDSTKKSSTKIMDILKKQVSDDDLLIIALSVIGLLAALICGLVIFIIRRRRLPPNTAKAKNENIYDTLKYPGDDTIKVGESENEYRIISFDNTGLTTHIEGKFGEYNNTIHTRQTDITNPDNQLTTTERELYDVEDHYDKLP